MTPELNHRQTHGVAPQRYNAASRLSTPRSHFLTQFHHSFCAQGSHNVVGPQMPCEISRRT